MDPRIREVLAWLERNPGAPLRVASLAEHVGLSVSRLEHLFRSHTHMSLREYLNRQRLHRAARELRHSTERISTIAFDAGFSDACNFTHAFKRYFGMSPRAYRRASPHRHANGHGIRQTEPSNSRSNQLFAHDHGATFWQYEGVHSEGAATMPQHSSAFDATLTSEDAIRLANADKAFMVALTLHPEQFRDLFSLSDVDMTQVREKIHDGVAAAPNESWDPDSLTIADALRLARADELFGAALFSYPEDFQPGFGLRDAEVALLASVPETSTVEDAVAAARAQLNLPSESDASALNAADALRLAEKDHRVRAALVREPARFAQPFNLTDDDVRRITEALDAKA